uniref:Uncharacterized protein n=1 Tax=Zea mays TaxID=4577 RepID=A0A804RK88_MAIZE
MSRQPAARPPAFGGAHAAYTAPGPIDGGEGSARENPKKPPLNLYAGWDQLDGGLERPALQPATRLGWGPPPRYKAEPPRHRQESTRMDADP